MNNLNLIIDEEKIDVLKLQNDICNELGKSVFTNWFSGFSIVEQTSHVVAFAFESRFVKEWVSLNYDSALLRILRQYLPNLVEVNYLVKEKSANEHLVINQVQNQTEKRIANLRNDNNKIHNDNSSSDFTFENFVTERENLLAYTALKNLSSVNNVGVNADILFIYGNVGVGKTHLLKALSHELQKSLPSEKVIYSSSERFVYNYVKALRSGNLVQFKESFSEADYFLIDDFQFIQAKGSSQQELLGFIDYFADAKKKIVIAADRAPNSFTEIDQKIVSRINGGLVLKIDNPKGSLKKKITEAKAKYNDIVLSDEIMNYIAESVYTIREIDGIISKLKIYKDIFATDISFELAQEVIGDIGFNNNSKRVLTVEDIQIKVSHYFGLTQEDIISQRRHKIVSRARHLAMYLAKIRTQDSLVVIAKKFNRLDHSTVAHAYSKVSKNISEYPEIAAIEKRLAE